jgi:hypothetical protein
VKTIPFIVKKIATPSLVIIQRASPSAPRDAVIDAANRQPRQQKRGSPLPWDTPPARGRPQ